uniref:Uncharacterized protein n=1 Tax=Rhipicephalus zambeziensis TaxID=60191 RepID=A0A224YEM8_9ACAR
MRGFFFSFLPAKVAMICRFRRRRRCSRETRCRRVYRNVALEGAWVTCVLFFHCGLIGSQLFLIWQCNLLLRSLVISCCHSLLPGYGRMSVVVTCSS